MNLLNFDESLRNHTIYDNPYPLYKWMRNHTPVYKSIEKNAWIITRYSDILKLISSGNLTVKRNSIQTDLLRNEYVEEFSNFFKGWLMYLEGNEHIELRKKVKRLLSNNSIFYSQTLTNEFAISLVDKYSGIGQFDVVKDYAELIAISAVCNLFQIPSLYHRMILEWSKSIICFMQGRFEQIDHFDASTKALEAIRNINKFLMTFLNQHPGFLEFFGVELKEAINIASNIIVDGFEPISNAISNSIFTLARYSEFRDIILKNGITDKVILELIRFDPPFQYIVRMAKREFEINSVKVLTNERILLMIASANHDPYFVNTPELLIVDRKENAFSSFGLGLHSCVGMNLAVSIVNIALTELMKQMPIFYLNTNKIDRYKSLGSRAICSLPIYW